MSIYGKIHTLYTGGVKTVGNPDADNKMNQQWKTGAFKEKTDKPVFLSKEGLAGDECADKKNHGGPEKALFAYSLAHYDNWQRELGNSGITAGGNGENISVMHMDETTVHIADIYELGGTMIQVSQPRRPCWKPARRHGDIDLAKKIEDTGRTGWYFRVLEEGSIQAGDTFKLLERPCPDWTIGRMNEVLYHNRDNIGLLENLRDSKFTPPSWKSALDKLLAGERIDDSKRLYGPNI
ncbi:MOSC domain-containing protein [Jeotgalicoccus halotolerans]|uniref:MOSC domain-containing protein YiiM n=1 Tax=Jeotgalicoccus halotolerans TaxID=157227 RepID=A0A3E0AX18_9STAP|nr:MOSC domain-containing protein [Jeotgalicoccus halotolerans]REG24278.1 MOSC domain-containing protein YiiM [Jeotgalicoccus halotolerans]